jgi:hypothetical protein
LENSLAVSYKLIYNMNQHFHLGVLTQEKWDFMFTHKSCLLVTIAALFVMKAAQMFLDKLWYIPTMNTTIIKNEPG